MTEGVYRSHREARLVPTVGLSGWVSRIRLINYGEGMGYRDGDALWGLVPRYNLDETLTEWLWSFVCRFKLSTQWRESTPRQGDLNFPLKHDSMAKLLIRVPGCGQAPFINLSLLRIPLCYQLVTHQTQYLAQNLYILS